MERKDVSILEETHCCCEPDEQRECGQTEDHMFQPKRELQLQGRFQTAAIRLEYKNIRVIVLEKYAWNTYAPDQLYIIYAAMSDKV